MLVLVGVDRELSARTRVAQGEIRLQARLGIEIRVAGDEATARRTAVVAIGENGIAETARDLAGQAQPSKGSNGQGRETGPRHIPGRAVAEKTPDVRRGHTIRSRSRGEVHRGADRRIDLREEADVVPARVIDGHIR